MDRHLACAALLLSLITLGCGKQQETPTPQAAGPSTTSVAAKAPAAPSVAKVPSASPEVIEQLKAGTATADGAVREFLTAVQAGNEELAAAMLTDVARQKTAEMDMVVSPPGSATAQFEVAQVEFVTETKDGAHVLSKWTDVGPNGEAHTDEIIWVLRKEPHGWRIAGMATKVFPDEPPLILNFEDPEDMLRKQQLTQQEMERRAAQQVTDQQAQKPAVPGDLGTR